MRRIIVLMSLIAIVLIAVHVAGAGSVSAPLSTPDLEKIIGSNNKSTVVFFINPQGLPCKEQNEILQKLHKDRTGNFNIAYVSTTNPEDQKAFYDYGVRNLPTVVLVDKNGKIQKVFPPGIQSYRILATALDGLK